MITTLRGEVYGIRKVDVINPETNQVFYTLWETVCLLDHESWAKHLHNTGRDMILQDWEKPNLNIGDIIEVDFCLNASFRLVGRDSNLFDVPESGVEKE